MLKLVLNLTEQNNSMYEKIFLTMQSNMFNSCGGIIIFNRMFYDTVTNFIKDQK